jgi:DNA polymerase-3 subunit gamma/tau
VAYQVLARKWRPKSLEQVQGQGHVTQALTNALKRGWLHHAYLFCGTRGVGKTSLARIFAKCLNCETGITDKPCGSCDTCQNIDAGRFVDLIEVDAASRTRVEDTRDLLENVAYNPTSGRFKTYIIDEVHMLSGHSFNALLKTLEEPPEHVKFIFATTEPERIPVTVLSRVLRFDLKPLSLENITVQLEKILKAEEITYTNQSLHYIADNSKGSMRDALSLLEQVMAFCDGNLESNIVAQLLGLSYQEHLPDLILALKNNNFDDCIKWLDMVSEAGVDYSKLLDGIISSLYVLSLREKVPQSARQHALMYGVPESICDLEHGFSAEDLQLLYQIGIMGKKDMVWAPDPKLNLQMTLLRMLDFRPDISGAIEFMPQSVSSDVSITKRQVKEHAQVQPKQETVNVDQYIPHVDTMIEENSAPEPIANVAKNKNDNSGSTLEKVRRKWATLVDSLNLVGFVGMLARHCTVKEWQKGQLILAIHPQQQAYLSADRKKELEDAINHKIGKKLLLRIEVEALDVVTPNQEAVQKRSAEENALRAKVESNDMVQALTNAFDAKVGDIKVVEVDDGE